MVMNRRGVVESLVTFCTLVLMRVRLPNRVSENSKSQSGKHFGILAWSISGTTH